jgi:hypothetical protein
MGVPTRNLSASGDRIEYRDVEKVADPLVSLLFPNNSDTSDLIEIKLASESGLCFETE